MRRTLITLAARRRPLRSECLWRKPQDEKTVGGHIGFVLPLVTHANGQTINDTADQFSIGFPTGITYQRKRPHGLRLSNYPIYK